MGCPKLREGSGWLIDRSDKFLLVDDEEFKNKTLLIRRTNINNNVDTHKEHTMKISQREAIYQAVQNAFAEAGIEFTPKMDVSELLTEAMMKQIRAEVTEGFLQGLTDLKDTPNNQAKLANPAEMTKYVSSLISNWVRKDENLNGGVDYEPKNPGSRAGSSDPQLKALKQLAVQFKGTTKAAEIAKHIEVRTAQITAEKAKKVLVDISKLPADLVASLGLIK